MSETEAEVSERGVGWGGAGRQPRRIAFGPEPAAAGAGMGRGPGRARGAAAPAEVAAATLEPRRGWVGSNRYIFVTIQ